MSCATHLLGDAPEPHVERIAFLIDSLHPYGAERIAAELASALAAHASITLITFKGSAADNERWCPATVSHIHVPVHATGVARFLHLSWRLARMARDLQPTVLVGFMPYANAVVAFVGALRGIPVVATEHTIMSIAQYGGRERPLLHLAMRVYLRRVARVVAVSHAVAEDLVANFGAPRHAITVIYNPVDVRRLAANAAQCAPSVPPRRSGERRIIIAASLRAIKGHDWALVALTRLPQQYVLYVIGDGPRRESLRYLASQLGVDRRVIFVGWQDCAAAWLASADIVWVPSLLEGFGLSLAEAWALGVPVIAAASPGLKEIADFLDCTTVPVGDANALARATRHYLDEHRAPPPTLTAGQRQDRIQHLHPTTVARQYLSVISRAATS